jgi:hypothetical protein
MGVEVGVGVGMGPARTPTLTMAWPSTQAPKPGMQYMAVILKFTARAHAAPHAHQRPAPSAKTN